MPFVILTMKPLLLLEIYTNKMATNSFLAHDVDLLELAGDRRSASCTMSYKHCRVSTHMA